jgi:hypothetical protein
MRRTTVVTFAAVVVAAAGASADAQSSARQDRRDRQETARAQGIPPGQMPPANQCRVWYDGRPNGRQPSPTNCDRAEAIASRDANARVIYGENVYWDLGSRANGGPGVWGRPGDDNDRAVGRGRVRDPRIDGRFDQRFSNPAFGNGYRDGLTKGREDVEDGDSYDVNRHSWYRSATRGYESRLGTRYEYIDRYRRGFEAGYAEGYRIYRRR